MEYLKKHIKMILIILLASFSVGKCSQSCSRANEAEKLRTELHDLEISIDSMKQAEFVKTTALKDSIVKLNTTISIYEEKMSGLSQIVDLQSLANRQISEAKKNINIKVDQQK